MRMLIVEDEERLADSLRSLLQCDITSLSADHFTSNISTDKEESEVVLYQDNECYVTRSDAVDLIEHINAIVLTGSENRSMSYALPNKRSGRAFYKVS